MKAARPHDDAMVERLREDPAFADEYVTAALEEADQPGGGQALHALSTDHKNSVDALDRVQEKQQGLLRSMLERLT